MANTADRIQLLETAFSSGRLVSTTAVLLHQAVADYFYISASDSRYASIIREQGAMTAGELAKLSGLTTGAVTGLIDRLEAAKLVKRTSNPNDRRQVLVKASDKRLPELQNLFSNLSDKARQLLADYSDHDLELIANFNAETAKIMQSEAERLHYKRRQL